MYEKEASMALKKCETCGVFFGAENDEKECKNCSKPHGKRVVITGDPEHDKFTNARAIVYEQPQISPEELVSEMRAIEIDITVKEIMRYVTAGRLALVTDGEGTYCSSCGKRIQIGSMCSECSDKLEKFRNSVIKEEKKVEKKKTGGMHRTKKEYNLRGYFIL